MLSGLILLTLNLLYVEWFVAWLVGWYFCFVVLFLRQGLNM